MKPEQLLWYVRRARKMEQGELRARLASALDGVAGYVRWRLAAGETRHAAGSARFGFCGSTSPMLPDLPWKFRPTDEERGAMLAGVHHALGFPWAWRPGREAWHRAPDTGRTWPEKFSNRINCRPGNPIGDVRVIWEPNRLQQLVALALIAKFYPADAAAGVRLIKLQLLSWLEANPPRVGMNYVSSMECALRILSVCVASDLARPHLLGDDEYWRAVAALVLDHAAFTSTRLSLYSSLGNHTVAECTGLFVAALLFPEAPAAASWEARAKEVLARAARRVVLPDGGCAEQALHYHAQILDHLEIAARIGTHLGRDMGEIEAIRGAGTRFLAQFRAARDRLPRIGDDDEGSALSPYFASSWCAAADQSQPPPTNAAVTVWSGGGYTLVRSAADRAELLFDHGPLGMAPNFGHGHADALSLELRLAGETVLVDPGTFAYGGDARWRRYFRSTAAHNTVTVDGRSQAKDVGPFLWAESYRCEMLHLAVDPDRAAILVGRHDGYAALGVVHVRAVKIAAGYLLVLDRLQGSGLHDLCVRWHFAGAVAAEGGEFVPDGVAGFRCMTAGGSAQIVSGRAAPPAGWRSRRYGWKEPIGTLEVRHTGLLPHEFITGFALPSERGATHLDREAQALSRLLDSLTGVRPPAARAAAMAR